MVSSRENTSSADLWDVFHQALEIEGDRLDEFLAERLDDASQRQELRRLLAAHEQDHPLLDDPRWGEKLGLAASGRDADRLGERVGAFRLDAVLGEGGMGTVYSATQDEPVHRTVALKIVRAGLDSPEAHARFQAERQSLARMDHPHVASIYDLGTTDDGRPWFAMEKVEGKTLIEACDARRLGVEDRVRLVVEICRAVQHAHQKGIVHRDLKPSNVLVAEIDGRLVPKVIDFGVARALQDDDSERSGWTGSRIVGTPGYMSPEQLDPARPVDTRADIFALGVLLYELLTGRRPGPHSGEAGAAPTAPAASSGAERPSRAARASTVESAARRGATPVALGRRIAGDLDAVVLQCIEWDPDARYASASELAEDLERFLAGQPVSAVGARFGYRARKFVQRHRFATASVTVILALLIALVANTLIQSTRVRAALEESQAQNRRAERVSEFLAGLFRSADPSETLGEDTRVREVLDRGAARVADELAEDPRLRAELELVLSEIYGNLGAFDVATDLARASWHGHVATLGEDHPNALSARSDLGVWLQRVDRLDEAEEHFEQVLAGRRAVLGAEHPATLETLQNLANLRVAQNEWESARGLLEQLLEVQERVLGPDDPGTMTTVQGLAVVLQRTGEAARALPLIERALAFRRKDLGDDHPRTLTTEGNLGFVLYGLGRADEAVPVLRSVLEARRRVLGPEHADTLLTAQNLGAILVSQGDVDAAVSLLQETRSRYAATLGEQHSMTLNTGHNLGRAYLAGELWEEAERTYREVAAVAAKALPAEHLFHGVFASGIGAALVGAKRVEEARPVLERAVVLLESTAGPNHRHTVTARERLAAARTREDRAGQGSS